MGMVNKFFYTIVLAGLMSFLPLKTYAGEDVVRAGLFLDYAKKAKKALKSQDEVMSLNLTGHMYISDQTEKVTNFQREFDNYLSSFGDMLTLAASIYGIYYQVDQTLKNLKELKAIYQYLPEYWQKLKDFQSKTSRPMKKYYRNGVPYGTVPEMEEVFKEELKIENH